MLSIGLMSGTSMDGIDAALLSTDGVAEIKELGSISLDYQPAFKILLKAAEYAVRKNKGDLRAVSASFLPTVREYLKTELKLADNLIEEKIIALANYLAVDGQGETITFDNIVTHSTLLHATAINDLLKKTNHSAKAIDVIGYHGQTFYHCPADKITIQVGDGQQLARLTGITVVNDFRSKDVAAGGQGAPFAPLYHQALAIRDNLLPLAVVNCGGIANITVITGNTANDVIGFDTGPGNVLIDRYVRQYTQGREYFDRNGHYGKQGKVDAAVFQALYKKAITAKKNGKSFFDSMPPKSLDSGDLNLIAELNSLSIADACATLEAFTVDTIIYAVKKYVDEAPKRWLLAGGGWSNPVILDEFIVRLKNTVRADAVIEMADKAGWNSKALEAQIFAYLAVRCLKHLPISYPQITQVPAPMRGGQIFAI